MSTRHIFRLCTERDTILKCSFDAIFQTGLVLFIIALISPFLFNSGLQAQPNKIGINFKISNYGNTTAKTDPAVAYNSKNDEYFIVWFDKTNKEVWGRIISGSDPANSTTNSFRIDGGSAIDPARPAVAYNSDDNQYFVIWETTGLGVQYITGRAYDANGNALDATTIDYWRGWDARVEYCPDNSKYLIVYVNFKNVFGFWVNASYRMGATSPFLIGNSKFPISGGVDLAKGSNEYFMVAWSAKWDINNEEYSGIRGNFVHATQNLGSNSFYISWYDGQWYGAHDPAVAFNPDTKQYLVVWRDTRHHQTAIDNHSIYGQYVDQATTQKYHQTNFQIAPKSTTNNKQNPAIVFDKAHDSFLVTWDQDDIYGQMIQDSTIVGSPLPISTAANSQNSSRLVYNSTRKELLCVWEDHRITPSEIYGQRIEIVQSITVDKPAAGDVWNAGSTRYIRWHCQNFADSVRIFISYDGYNPQFWVAVDLMKNTPNDGSYEWIVPNNPSKNCVIMIVDAKDGYPVGYSGVFEITGGAESITIDVPNGGENWNVGSTRYIVWHNQNFNDPVKIEYSTDGGTNYSTIVASTTNSGSYAWTVPNTPSTQCRVRISDAASGNPSDVSDNNFAITANEAITLVVPNGGENWNVGSTRYIAWHNQNFNDPVKIEYSSDGGTNYSTIIASTTNSGSYTWTVPNTPSTNCLVKVSDAADGNPWDVSDSPFTISTSIGDNTNPGSNVQVNLGSGVNLTFDNVTGAGNTSLTTSITGPPAPGGFIIVPSGSPMYYDITTTATFTGNIKLYIQYNDAGMTTQEEAALKLHVYESGQWKDVTTSVDVNSNIICGTVSHLSDFAVMSPLASASITVIQPNGGENWVVGSEQEIKWTSTGFTDPVRIEYSIDGNASHLDVVSSTENDGSYLWVVPNTPSTNCVVIVSNATGGQPFDISDATFTISTVDPDNTHTGFDVTVTLNSSVSVTFDEVTSSGNTTLATSHTGPEPPDNFVVHPQSDPLFYEITTTAGYAGLIHLSIHYDDTELDTETEPNLGLYRFIAPHSEWLDITTSVDIDNNFIYGTTDQLSIFAIMYQTGSSAENGLIVTNCDDSGPGSLRDAILYANTNPGQDTIRFQIPVGVPGHDPDIGVWLITPQSELPTITESIYIDGFSQKEFIGEDTNPFGPEIWLNGELAGSYVHGLRSTADGTTIVGLTISNFQYAGIDLHDIDGGRISGCYVGVDFAGNAAAANGWGIWLVENTRNVAITPIDTYKNVISGNTNGGIVVRDSSNHITIMGNIIGLDRSGMYPIGNSNYGGIHITGQCDNVDVFDNWICGNRFGMIVVNSSNITIGNNFIGSNTINDETLELGNEYDGVWLAEGACDNVITENFIRYNGGSGVHIDGTNTVRNRVSHNHISGNGVWGIYNQSGGNLELAAPVISSATPTSITGTAVPNATVEMYTDPGYQGLLFQGETVSDPSGNFTWNGTVTGQFPNVTAIAIDDSGNTSAFSQVALITSVEKLEDSIIPETFSLSQNYPNPFNPSTTIRWQIPEASNVTLKIFDIPGREVATLVYEYRTVGRYDTEFDASHLPSGTYIYRLQAGEYVESKKLVLLK